MLGLAGVTVMEVKLGVPVPLSFTIWGLVTSLSVIVIVADLEPSAVGVNVAVTEQLALGVSVVPQVLV
jgi:hypothetical protein